MSLRSVAALTLGLILVPIAQAQPDSGVQWRPVHRTTPTSQQSAGPQTLPDKAPAANSVSAPQSGASAQGCLTACPEPCGPDGCAWTSFEWLYWTTSGQPMPVLATTSPAGTPRGLAGVNGVPTTVALFGGERVNNDFRNGFRFNAGVWLNERRTFGIDGDFFFLGQSSDNFNASTLNTPILTRPFFNALTNLPDTQIVSYPGAAIGGMSVNSTSNVIGGGLNLLCNLHCKPCSRLDLILGYRYFNLSDEVVINEILAADPNSGIRGTSARGFAITDQFSTSNNFHGGVIGLAGEVRRSFFYASLRASVALGGNTQITEIDGRTLLVDATGQPQSYAGGLYAQPTNIGRHTRTVFAVLPEIGIRGGIQVTPRIRAYAGYNFMYLSNVARAGDQIDTRVNPTLLPPRTVLTGPALPAFENRTTDFWVQGISVGLEVRY